MANALYAKGKEKILSAAVNFTADTIKVALVKNTYPQNLAADEFYTDISAYAVHNLRVGFRADSGWDVYGWVRNAFDREYYELLATTPGDTGLIAGQPGDPRTYGITARVKF